MKATLFILLLVSLCSCADVYEDITVHNDGSYSIKRVTKMENMLGMFGMDLGLGMMDSSVSPSKKERLVDSLSRRLIVDRAVFEKLPGFISYMRIDSSTDSVTISGVEIHLKDTTSLRQVHHILWQTTDSLRNSSASSSSDQLPSFLSDTSKPLPELQLSISRSDKITTLLFIAPEFSKDSLPVPAFAKKFAQAILSIFGLYIRVHSSQLLPQSETCRIESFDGYQQWKVPTDALFETDPKKKQATFMIRESN